jgi:dipeptidyl aminopeptidase/acylaminoacyl peptidase
MKKITLFLLLFSFLTQINAQNRLTPELLWSLGRVSLQDVSPDGQTVLYSVTYSDIKENKSSRDLYSIDISGDAKSLKKLTATPENEGNAQYRPDGKKIGYLKSGYIWEMNVDGTSPKQISDFTVNGFKYSPDGIHVLYINDVKYKQTTEEMYPDLPKANAMIIDDLMYRHWDHYEDESYSNVFLGKYVDGKVGGGLNIMREPFDSPLSPFGGLEQINWTPDGKGIVYVCKKMSSKAYAESTNSDIYLYTLKGGTTRNLTEANKGYDLDPVFSSDGSFMAYNSMEKDGYEADKYRLMVMDMKTFKIQDMTKGFDGNAHSPQFSPDDKAIYFTSETKGTQHIFQLSTENSKIRQLTQGTYNYYDFVATKEAIVARRCSMSQPHEIYRVAYGKAKPVPITQVNAPTLAKIDMGRVQSRTVKTTDGKDMLVWMIYPPNFDKSKKYPALLYCQGGPQSQVSQFWSTRWNFQMMAANDYIIVAPNRRGLPGFGKEWNEAISGDWGGQPMKDYFSAIDDAAKEPYINENRLGAVGASYGGYSVYWLAGNHNKRFKTFISHCGLFNLESWYGTTEELFFANQDIGGAYWDENPPKSYATDSPHKYVGNWDTPILVIHNEKDFRVPISEGMQAFNAAQMQGIPSRFLIFPEENHWVLTPQNGILWQRVFFEWLDRSLK